MSSATSNKNAILLYYKLFWSKETPISQLTRAFHHGEGHNYPHKFASKHHRRIFYSGPEHSGWEDKTSSSFSSMNSWNETVAYLEPDAGGVYTLISISFEDFTNKKNICSRFVNVTPACQLLGPPSPARGGGGVTNFSIHPSKIQNNDQIESSGFYRTFCSVLYKHYTPSRFPDKK